MGTPPHNAVTYQSYLKVPELLSLQTLLSEHHDETLFIVIHQVYELWFKQLLHELGEVIHCFQTGNIPRSIKVLNRILSIQKVLVLQIDVLETMTPNEFATFRDKLRPASGFQSVQFREVEFLSGLKVPQFIEMLAVMPDAQEKLRARMNAPTLYDYFIEYLAHAGFAIPVEVYNREYAQPYVAQQSVLEAIKAIYTQPNHYHELYMLCEALLSYDENFNMWRYRHVKMVERTIGMKTGTGGSTGAKYLATTLDAKFFPELWDVRNEIGSY